MRNLQLTRQIREPQSLGPNTHQLPLAPLSRMRCACLARAARSGAGFLTSFCLRWPWQFGSPRPRPPAFSCGGDLAALV